MCVDSVGRCVGGLGGGNHLGGDAERKQIGRRVVVVNKRSDRDIAADIAFVHPPSTHATMPDLLSALDKIAHETEQITHLSHANDRPPGRFTSAYLYIPTPGVRGTPNLFSLVRDATEAEKRPFGRLLAPSGASDPSRSIRDVSKRQSDAPTHGLTPLRNAQRARGTQHELEATLYAAEEVIEAMADSAHPMNRARKEVNDLIAQHEANEKRVAELERLLSEAMRGPKAQSEPEKKEEKEVEEKKEKAKSPDEAIAAEEEALRALEESLAPLRRQAAEKAQAARSPRKSAPSSPSVDRTPLARSTGLRRSQGPSSPSASKSPSSPKVSPKASTSTSRTPRRTPGAPAARTPLSSRHPLETPRRVAEPINRFSPLHLVATPRARLGSSTLRPGPEPGSTIVARMRASITPAALRSAYRSGFLGASTSRRVLPPPAASPAQEAVLVPDLSTTPKAAAAALAGTPAPAKEPPPPSPAKEPEGPSINPDMPSVATATVSYGLP